MTRYDGRTVDAMRPVKMDSEYLLHPEGSVLIQVGNTKVICTATVEDKVPGFFYVDKGKVGLLRNTPCYRVPQHSVRHANRLVAK